MACVCWRKLRSLFLCRNHFSEEVYSELSRGLAHLPHLERLHVDDCALNRLSEEFTGSLQYMHELQSLGLCENALHAADMQLLESCISGSFGLRKLTALEVYGNPVGLDGAHALCACIRQLRYIARVSLQATDVGGAHGVQVLDGVFRDNSGSSGRANDGVSWDWCPGYLRDLDGCETRGVGPGEDDIHDWDEYASNAGDAWSAADDDDSDDSSSEDSSSSSEAEWAHVKRADLGAILLG